MKPYTLFVAVGILLQTQLWASETTLVSVYQPLILANEEMPTVCRVPYATGGAFPEVFFNAITQPHPPLSNLPESVRIGDVNAASIAGVKISCVSATNGQTKLFIIWDFSKANEELVDESLINRLLDCLEKTADKKIILYSKFVAAERFSKYQKIISKRFPPQTKQQAIEDGIWRQAK